MSEQILKELEGLPPEVLAKIAQDAKVAKAHQLLADAGIPQPPSVPFEPVSTAKPGLKTSEGWLSYIISIVGAVLAAWGASKGNELISMIGSVLAGGTTVGYTFARTKAKS